MKKLHLFRKSVGRVVELLLGHGFRPESEKAKEEVYHYYPLC